MARGWLLLVDIADAAVVGGAIKMPGIQKPKARWSSGETFKEQGQDVAGPAFNGNIDLVGDIDSVAKLTIAQPDNVAFTKQTTLAGDDNPLIIYATQNRQDAVREMTAHCDLVLVVGSPNSSNSNRLRELAEREGVEAYLIDGADEIDPGWTAGKRSIGVTAGASAPDVLVQGVLARLTALGAGSVRELHGEPENMVFALPKELRLQLVD